MITTPTAGRPYTARKGYYPEIGDSPYNIRFLYRSAHDFELRRIAGGPDPLRAPLAARELAARAARRTATQAAYLAAYSLPPAPRAAEDAYAAELAAARRAPARLLAEAEATVEFCKGAYRAAVGGPPRRVTRAYRAVERALARRARREALAA
jgi:hypothetical protein